MKLLRWLEFKLNFDRICARSTIVYSCCRGFAFLIIASKIIHAQEPNNSYGNWDGVHSVLLEAETEISTLDVEGVDTLHRSFVHRIIGVASSNDLYYLIGHGENAGEDHWKNEPFNLELLIHGEERVSHHKFNRSYSIHPFPAGSRISQHVLNDTLLTIMPVWPLLKFKRPEGYDQTMLLVVGQAVTSGTYNNANERQNINGEWCYQIVSSSGRDRIWIAEDKALCVMQRDWIDIRTGTLAERLSTTQIAEIGPGLWVPIEFVSLQYATDSAKETPRMKRRSTTRILEWKLNSDVPISLFYPRFMPGSIVEFDSTHFHQSTPGGIDLLDEFVTYIQSRGNPPPAVTNRQQFDSRLHCFISRLTAGALIGIAMHCFVRRNRALIGCGKQDQPR